MHSQLSNLFIQAGTKKAAFSLQYFTITEFLEGKWGNRVAAINSTGGRCRQQESRRRLRSRDRNTIYARELVVSWDITQ